MRQYVRNRKLLFGLYVEPEAVGTKTRLMEQHPEWVARRDDNPYFVVSSLGPRIHGLLDMTNSEAAGWIEGELRRLIETYELDLLRIDFDVAFHFTTHTN